MKKILLLILFFICVKFLSAATGNWTKIVNTSTTPAVNAPMTLFKPFKKGDFPVGTYPQPSIAGVPLSIYQTNIVKSWPDASQTCIINSISNGPLGNLTEPSINFTCAGRPVLEGETLTLACIGSGCSIPSGQYALVGITSTSPTIGYLPRAVATSTTITGLTITAVDYGSVFFAYVTFPYNSVPVVYTNGNVTAGLIQIDFIPNKNSCYLGSLTVCNASGLTQAAMLGFNNASWDIQSAVSVNQNKASAVVDARTMLSAGAFRYLIRGPLRTQIILEDLTPSGPIYDFGFEDLATTVLTANVTSTTTTTIHLNCDGWVALGSVPTNISVMPIHAASPGVPEIMTITACSAGMATAIRNVGGTPGTPNQGSAVRWLSATPGWSGSWTERPLATGNNQSGQRNPGILSASATSTPIGGYDFFAQIASNLPYNVQTDSEIIPITSVTNSGSGYATLNFGTRSSPTSHGGNGWYYAQPWFSNWINAPSATYKSNHPSFILDFYTPDGIHQWPGVDWQFILKNGYLHKAQDQFFNLTIKTGAGLNTTFVNNDRVPMPWGSEFQRRGWDGVAPGGVNTPFGTQTGSGVAIDYNFSYLVASGVIPPFNTSNYPVSASELAGDLAAWCLTGPVTFNIPCTNPSQQSWYYTQPGNFRLSQNDAGGRPENSHITRYDADVLYAMNVTTQIGVANTLQTQEMLWGQNQGVTHWTQNYLDDSTTTFFDAQHTISSFGRTISRDAHPTAAGQIGSAWFTGCTGIDCPTLIGITENISVPNGGRIGDQFTFDTAHSGTYPWVSYILTGDCYYLDNMYQWASTMLRAQQTGTGRENSHANWAILTGQQTRGYAWPWRDISIAALFAPDGSPEQRYFNQKLTFNTMAREGWMLINNGWFADANNNSPYYWGLNTVHPAGINNPLGLWNEYLGVPEVTDGTEQPTQASCTSPYPICIGTKEAPWQNTFGLTAVSLSYSLGFNQAKYIRQAMALGELALINNSNPNYMSSAEYFSTRTSANNGTTPVVGTGSIPYSTTDITQAAINSWPIINGTYCTTLTSGCTSNDVTASLGRWNVGPDEDESYPSIQLAGLASIPDIDIGPTCQGVSGTCYQWMVANIPNQNTFVNYETWNWAPLPTILPPINLTVTSIN